jgi:hypothetical protein
MHILRTVNVIYSGTTGGAGNVSPSGTLEFTHGFQWGSRCSIFLLCFVRFFFSSSFDQCINYRSFFELRLLILKLFFAVRLRFPLTWSFTTKNICRITIRDNLCVIFRSKTTTCTWYVIQDFHFSFDIWKW